jgi:hypothetical protein
MNVFNGSPNPHDEQVIPTMIKKGGGSFVGEAGGELGEFNGGLEILEEDSEIKSKSDKLTNE